MSPDPTPSENTPQPKPLPTRTNTQSGNENDLWDFDSDEIEAPENASPPASTEEVTLPLAKKSESPIQSRKPTERRSDPSPTPEKEEKPEPKPASNPPTTPKTAPAKAKAKAKAKPAPDSPAPSETPTPPPHNPQSLTKSEKIATFLLVAILCISAALCIIYFSNRVPTRSLIEESLALPIQGKYLKITSLETFWRPPITTGKNPETVRRGTQVIPVVKFKTEGKPATLRIFFRDQNGQIVGDAINRSISADTELTIPATAGFEDIGMHAAYRTGEVTPWIIQILEAKTPDASIDQFTKILETEISSDIRK